MSSWAYKYKPAASARTHLILAALMWTTVGAVLLIVGTRWTRSAGPVWMLLLAIAAAIGLAKARFVLSKSARRIAGRIQTRGDGRCLGGFISWQTWLLVIAMMVLGRLLRGGLLPRTAVGFVYEAVGVALLAGAVSLWQNVKTPAQSSAPNTDG